MHPTSNLILIWTFLWLNFFYRIGFWCQRKGLRKKVSHTNLTNSRNCKRKKEKKTSFARIRRSNEKRRCCFFSNLFSLFCSNENLLRSQTFLDIKIILSHQKKTWRDKFSPNFSYLKTFKVDGLPSKIWVRVEGKEFLSRIEVGL